MKLPRMSAAKFDELLTSLGACWSGKTSAQGQTLYQALDAARRPDWMSWLLEKMSGQPGWPTLHQVVLMECSVALPYLSLLPEDKRVQAQGILDGLLLWANGEREATPEPELIRASEKDLISSSTDAAFHMRMTVNNLSDLPCSDFVLGEAMCQLSEAVNRAERRSSWSREGFETIAKALRAELAALPVPVVQPSEI